MKPRLLTGGIAGLLLGIVPGACEVSINTAHCTNNAAGYCGDGMVCDECADHKTGCKPEGTVADNCIYVPDTTGTDTDATGGSSDGTASTTGTTMDPTDGGTDSVTTSSTSAGTGTTGPTTGATTTGPVCTADVDCEDPTPYCEGEVCVACQEQGAGFCAGKDAGTPACDDSTGGCVQCTAADAAACTGTTPICADADNTCVGCTEHAQCTESACDLETGACMPTDKVYWVDKDNGSCSDAGAGTEAMPFCTIGAAVGQVGNGEKGTINIQKAATAYAEQVQLGSNKTYAILGIGSPEITAGDFDNVNVGGIAYLAGVHSINAKDFGVRCGDTVWIDDSRLEGNTDGGVNGNGCNAHIRRTEIVQNDGDGINLSGSSELWMENSVVGVNGQDLQATHGILNTGSTLHIVYSTIAANEGSGTTVDSIECLGGGAGDIRNSIIVDQDQNSISCPGLTVNESAVRDDDFNGGTNTAINSFDAGWFTNAGNGDFHLQAGNPFMDVATRMATDPATDIDGDARPAAGMTDYAGADEP